MLRIEYNPDVKKAVEMQQKVRQNSGYCPNKPEHTINTRCMCKEFRDRITEGLCDCGLYYKRKIKDDNE